MRTLAALGILVAACSGSIGCTGRPFTLADAFRTQTPDRIAVAGSGDRASFVGGDTLYVLTDRDGFASGADPVAQAVIGGMRRQGSINRPFAAWSPDGRALVFRSGTGGVFDLGRPLLLEMDQEQIRVAPLLPDTLAGRLLTFTGGSAGEPSWSHNNRLLSFIARPITDGGGLGASRIYTIRRRPTLRRMSRSRGPGAVGSPNNDDP